MRASTIKRWVKDAFTEPNGETICVIRVISILTFTYAMVSHAWSIYVLHAVFDLSSFGLAWAGMLTALGVALGMKTDTGGNNNVIRS